MKYNPFHFVGKRILVCSRHYLQVVIPSSVGDYNFSCNLKGTVLTWTSIQEDSQLTLINVELRYSFTFS